MDPEETVLTSAAFIAALNDLNEDSRETMSVRWTRGQRTDRNVWRVENSAGHLRAEIHVGTGDVERDIYGWDSDKVRALAHVLWVGSKQPACIPSVERGCTGKANLGRDYVKYADRMSVKHGKQYGVYRCPHCGGTHLTTKLDIAAKYFEPLLYATHPR